MKAKTMQAEHQVHPIPPFYDKNSRILVLGSFPSVKSRETGFFYGHPQNRYWKMMAEIFGEDNFYLELQDHDIQEQRAVNQGIRRLARETGLPMVVTNDAHYLRREDAGMQDVLLCVQTGKTVDDPNRMKFQTEEFYLKSEDELRARFPGCDEAFRNTAKIAEQCNLEFTFH